MLFFRFRRVDEAAGQVLLVRALRLRHLRKAAQVVLPRLPVHAGKAARGVLREDLPAHVRRVQHRLHVHRSQQHQGLEKRCKRLCQRLRLT